MRGFRIRPSYANVVATVALFVALGGTAIATHPGGQNTISTADIQNGEVKVADVGQGAVATDELANGQVKATDIGDGEVRTAEIATNQIKAADIGDGEVKTAEIATGAVRTEELANGQVQAADLAPGVAPRASGARAWGLVDAAGTLLRSKQVSSVTNPFEGAYCIDPAPGIDPTTAVMVVGEDFSGNSTSHTSEDVSHVEWQSFVSHCPAGRMQVRTFFGDGQPGSSGEIDSGGFDLVSQNQGFTFVIP